MLQLLSHDGIWKIQNVKFQEAIIYIQNDPALQKTAGVSRRYRKNRGRTRCLYNVGEKTVESTKIDSKGIACHLSRLNKVSSPSARPANKKNICHTSIYIPMPTNSANKRSNTWILALCLFAAVIYIRARSARKHLITEPYEAMEENMADSIVKKLIPRLASRDVIQGVSLVSGTTKKFEPGFKEKWIKGNAKAVNLQAAPKFTLSNGTVIIGPSWISVKGYGKTAQKADNDAKRRAQDILSATMDRLRMRGLAAIVS